jgi:N-6 DNA Methylase
MVEVINPQLGEVILDLACSTGGFLVESFKHLEKQCKTVEDRHALQTQSIFGGEAKPLPYLLAQMNLVLHGLESPKIDPLNSLRFPLREITSKRRRSEGAMNRAPTSLSSHRSHGSFVPSCAWLRRWREKQSLRRRRPARRGGPWEFACLILPIPCPSKRRERAA